MENLRIARNQALEARNAGSFCNSTTKFDCTQMHDRIVTQSQYSNANNASSNTYSRPLILIHQ